MVSILLFLDNVIYCETSDRVLIDCFDREVLDSVTSVRDSRKKNNIDRGIDDSIFVEFINIFCGIVDFDDVILIDVEETLVG